MNYERYNEDCHKKLIKNILRESYITGYEVDKAYNLTNDGKVIYTIYGEPIILILGEELNKICKEVKEEFNNE